MSMYRARPCPKCQYYVGYSVARQLDGTPESQVESFCLNCNYRLPVRAVIGGMKKIAPRQIPSNPTRALQRANDFHGTARLAAAAAPSGEESARVRDYPRELRAIGQELERRGFKTFNLKCSGDAYFVWSTETLAPTDAAKTESGSGAEFCDRNPRDPAMKMLLDRIVGFQFTAVQIQRLEQKGRQNRRYASAVSDRSCLSHLLRTVGEQVYQHNERLLAIAWRDRTISIVTKSAGGRLDMEVLRSDNLYDLWVRMYLQRSH